MKTCSKSGCGRRVFMDTDRCFDHQRGSAGFRIFFALCLMLGLTMAGVGIWAVVELVTWVTSK